MIVDVAHQHDFVGAGLGGVGTNALLPRFGVRWAYRLVPLIALPTAGVLLVGAVHAANPYLAVAALAAGGMVGILTSGLIPGLASWHVGICSLQSWVACVCVYACLRFLERPIVLDDQQRAMFERLLPVEEAVT